MGWNLQFDSSIIVVILYIVYIFKFVPTLKILKKRFYFLQYFLNLQITLYVEHITRTYTIDI